jgi:hypothetical protein
MSFIVLGNRDYEVIELDQMLDSVRKGDILDVKIVWRTGRYIDRELRDAYVYNQNNNTTSITDGAGLKRLKLRGTLQYVDGKQVIVPFIPDTFDVASRYTWTCKVSPIKLRKERDNE